jgi:membrane protein DedA with SNARE-associated domain
MFEWIAQFTSHALHIVAMGNLQDLEAISLIAFLTEFGVPFPLVMDSVLFLIGYQIEDSWLKAIIVIFVLLIAREAGSTIVYQLFHSLGNPLVKWLARRFPSIPQKWERLTSRLRIKTTLALVISRLGAEVPLAASGLGFRAPVTIALTRLTPGLLSLTSIVSGTLKFRYIYFAAGIGISSLFSDCTVIIMGVITSYGLRQLSSTPPSWLLIIGIIINIIVVMTIQRFIWRNVGKKIQMPFKI